MVDEEDFRIFFKVQSNIIMNRRLSQWRCPLEEAVIVIFFRSVLYLFLK
jgi:hypothetical protein